MVAIWSSRGWSASGGGLDNRSSKAAPGHAPVAESDGHSEGTTLQLGQLRVLATRGRTGRWEKLRFEVGSDGLESAVGTLHIAHPSADARGVVTLTSGRHGNSLWSDWRLARKTISDLTHNGLIVVELGWETSWLTAAPGGDHGVMKLASRPATVFGWIHENIYAPLGLPRELGRCGFALVGMSGGATQVTYSLSHYGLAKLVDVAIPISGPPHAAQCKGCLRNTHDRAFWYDEENSALVDASYGFVDEPGPCARHDASWASRWMVESNFLSGTHYYPTTRIHMILGGRDRTEAVSHARAYLSRVKGCGSPLVRVETVPSMGHVIQSSAQGLAALKRALLSTAEKEPYDRGADRSLVPLPLADATGRGVG